MEQLRDFNRCFHRVRFSPLPGQADGISTGHGCEDSMALFIRLVTALSKFCGGFAAALIVVTLALVCQMVVLRYGLGQPAARQAELVTYLVIAVTFIASPYVLATRGHVNMNVLPRYLGGRGRTALALLASLFSLGFCLGLVWAGLDLLYEAVAEGWRTDAVEDVGLWIPYLSLPLGVGVLALQYVADILGSVTGRGNGDDQAPCRPHRPPPGPEAGP
jgi:TRAP-type C4-dicarboxylate transport system permease small subunit